MLPCSARPARVIAPEHPRLARPTIAACPQPSALGARPPHGPSPPALAAGVAADLLWADPRAGHPVAGFGAVAAATERVVHRDSRLAGHGVRPRPDRRDRSARPGGGAGRPRQPPDRRCDGPGHVGGRRWHQPAPGGARDVPAARHRRPRRGPAAPEPPLRARPVGPRRSGPRARDRRVRRGEHLRRGRRAARVGAIGGVPGSWPTAPSTRSTRWSATTRCATSASGGRPPGPTTSPTSCRRGSLPTSPQASRRSWRPGPLRDAGLAARRPQAPEPRTPAGRGGLRRCAVPHPRRTAVVRRRVEDRPLLGDGPGARRARHRPRRTAVRCRDRGAAAWRWHEAGARPGPALTAARSDGPRRCRPRTTSP
jgi:hypothetical protein